MKRKKKNGLILQKKNRRYFLVGIAALLSLVLVSAFGWHWASKLKCSRIEVTGARLAEVKTVIGLSGVDTSMVMLDIDPVLVADRVRRDPWISVAHVQRLPTGTLSIRVEERTPVVLVLDKRGKPSRYLDETGAQMPLREGAFFDVPLMRGVHQVFHPVQHIEDPIVRAYLRALASAPPTLNALVSEVERRSDGDIWIQTVPAGESGAISVRLGHDEFTSRLARLGAFWNQAVLAYPDHKFQFIDLRFERQIVTRES